MKLPLKLKEHSLTVRQPRMSDANELMSYYNSLVRENVDILSNKKVTLKEEREKLKKMMADIKAGKRVILIALRNKQVASMVDVGLLKGKSMHVGVLGISVARDYRGRGLGKKLMQLIIEFAQEKLKGLEVIELEVFRRNKPAIHLYKTMGFKKVGVRPKVMKSEGEYHDSIIMHKWLR